MLATLSGQEGEPREIDPAHLPAVLERRAEDQSAVDPQPMPRSKPRSVASSNEGGLRCASLIAPSTAAGGFQFRGKVGRPVIACDSLRRANNEAIHLSALASGWTASLRSQ